MFDKYIKVCMLKGQKGNSAYQEAVENDLFSGTLEEWIESFATPENYITRTEFQKVTQSQYDAMAQEGTLVPNCYYLIIDDNSANDFETIKDDIADLKTSVNTNTQDIVDLKDTTITNTDDIADNKNDISSINTKLTPTTTLMACNVACEKYFSGKYLFLNATVTYSIDEFGLDYIETSLIFEQITQNDVTTYRAYYIRNGVLTLYDPAYTVNVTYIQLVE